MSDDVDANDLPAIPEWQVRQALLFDGATADHLVYDFYKGMTSICALTLGGILTLSESLFADAIPTKGMLACAVIVAAAAILSLQCQVEIVHLRSGKRQFSRILRIGDRVVPGLFGAAIGLFLSLIIFPDFASFLR